ncbi:MAG: hypothetical protein LBR86_06065 [Tannerella sp.]|jgi:hypothetical protein|nr:hypothetical protein [Tannerella sp.]
MAAEKKQFTKEPKKKYITLSSEKKDELREAITQVERGEYIEISSKKELETFFNSL